MVDAQALRLRTFFNGFGFRFLFRNFANYIQLLQNILTHSRKIFSDCKVGVSQNRYLFLFQICISFQVFLRIVNLMMLRTVKLNDKPRTCAIEIHNIRTDYLLPVYPDGEIFQKVIP